MASLPLVPPELPEEGQELTDEQWWALFDYLRLAYPMSTAPYGGPVEFVRRLREDEDPFRVA